MVLNPVFSNSDSTYEKAMKDAIGKMDQAASIDDFLLVANQFERISNVEIDNWLPLYHAAYAMVIMAVLLKPAIAWE